MARRPEPRISKVTVWECVRDVLIHAINKGQLPAAAVALILIIVALRLPPDKLGQLVDVVVNWHYGLSLIGYLIAIVVLVAWLWHHRWCRGVQQREMDRLVEERNFWQGKVMGEPMRSSEAGDQKEG